MSAFARPGLFVLVLGLLAGLGGSCGPPGSPDGPPENLVFISLDTTRRDHLPTYGYARDTAPYLERLARSGVVFENAVAQMTITNPSHASMFTGLYPHTHKVGENTRQLGEEHTTLTEVLAAAGFRTAAFVSGHPLKQQITGLDQGFDLYDSDFTTRRRWGRETVDRALAWLREGGGGGKGPGRFFLFLHLYDAHGPYKPREGYEDLFRAEDRGPKLGFIPKYQKLRDADGNVLRHLADYVDRYDTMLRYQDDLVAELLAAVDLSRTLVVVVADHGETLGDRATPLNLNHGTSVFEEQVGIPMIFHGPGLGPRRVTEPAETVDLLPTLAELLEVPLPEGLPVQGESLAAAVRGAGAPPKRGLAYATNRARTENHKDRGYELAKGSFIHSVRTRDWKLILYPGVEETYTELYDLAQDPGETANVAAEHADLAERMRSGLAAWQATEADGAEAPEAELSPELLEQMRSLGYVD